VLREFHTKNDIPIAPQRPVRVVDSRGKTSKDICFRVEVCVEWNIECLQEDLRHENRRWLRVADLFAEFPDAFDLVDTYLKTARLRWPPLVDVKDPLELVESRQIGTESFPETEYLAVFALNPIFIRPPPKTPTVAGGNGGDAAGVMEGGAVELVPDAVAPSVVVHCWRRRESLPPGLVDRFVQMEAMDQKKGGKAKGRGKPPAVSRRGQQGGTPGSSQRSVRSRASVVREIKQEKERRREEEKMEVAGSQEEKVIKKENGDASLESSLAAGVFEGKAREREAREVSSSASSSSSRGRGTLTGGGFIGGLALLTQPVASCSSAASASVSAACLRLPLCPPSPSGGLCGSGGRKRRQSQGEAKSPDPLETSGKRQRRHSRRLEAKDRQTEREEDSCRSGG